MAPAPEKAFYWLLTINNPTPEDRLALSDPDDIIRRAWYQDEIGETGTPHIQCCLNTKQVRFAAIKNLFPRAHIEMARNENACKQYCQKHATSVPGTYVYFTRNAIHEVPAESVEVDNSPFLSSLNMLLAAIPYDWHLKEPEAVYREALNEIATFDPTLVERLTQQRIRTAFIQAFSGLLANYQHNLVEYPLDMEQPECPHGLSECSDHPTIQFTECMVSRHFHKDQELCMGCSDLFCDP